jgi:hypothetical protein
MRLARPLIAWLMIVGLSSTSFAGDLHESISRAAAQQAQAPTSKIDKAYLLPGVALFGAGLAMATYGFLHTSGGEFVSGQVSKESKTELGGVGLAVAGAGGAILYLGTRRAKQAPSVTITPRLITVSKRIAW